MNNSFGIGDRFGMQGTWQLKAFQMAEQEGRFIIPVWNKSYREHSLVKTVPEDVRNEADTAVKVSGWSRPYYVDADHINFETAEGFLASSDFFTIDVADRIGVAPGEDIIEDFKDRNRKYAGSLQIEGLKDPVSISQSFLSHIAGTFVPACIEATRIYRKIREGKGNVPFRVEVSMDEVDRPQSPAELFFILAELVHAGMIPDTIAPRFTGNFHKGVDYIGDLSEFEKEFEQDLLVIEQVRTEFGIEKEIRLSVHSGSDKFSIYPAIRKISCRHNRGIHLKTAGMTWLEEFTGLVISGNEGLGFAKFLYGEAYNRLAELTKPYLMVTNVQIKDLPEPEELNSWDAKRLAESVMHDSSCRSFNPALRQLMHLSYKIAAENFDDFSRLVHEHAETIGKRVTDNIYQRHIKPLFIDPV